MSESSTAPTEGIRGRSEHSTLTPLEDAQRALDGAARPGEPGRAGRLERDLVSSVNAAGEAAESNGLGVLLDGVESLVQTLPPLVRALDVVAQIHPVLAVTVGAFKVVVELEVKRHDNDKKVNLLFLEMRNMMATLVQLQDVRAHHVGGDGLTIGDRLKSLSEGTAKDIKECANACDTYARKRLLVKVIKAPSWNATLKEYIQRFSDRKSAFSFAISLHTGIGIDGANDKLDDLMKKMDVILEFFEKTIPREQLVLAEAIRQAGGAQAALADAPTLQALLAQERQLEAASRSSDPTPSTTMRLAQAPLTGTYSPGPYYAPRASENLRTRPRPSPQRQNSVQSSLRADGSPGYPAAGVPPNMEYGQSGSRSPAEPGKYTRPSPAKPYPPAAQLYTPSPARPYVPLDAPGYSRPSPAYEYVGIGTPGVQPRSAPPAPYRTLEADEGYYPSTVELTRMKLVQELADEPAVAIKKNMVWFERKFQIQQHAIVEKMKEVVAHEGDRVISSVLAGPHEKIVDPIMYEIWRDMRWRRIVKSRHLILAIHDYYTQLFDDQQRAALNGTTPPHPTISENDVWALKWLDLPYHPHIIEAMDNDASGFVTIQEINYFTTLRPKGWSSLRWLAYWAVGWRAAMSEYKRDILALLDRMRGLLPDVRWRGYAAATYVDNVAPLVYNMTGPFREETVHRFTHRHFRDYIDQEEARLREGLETAKYDLDGFDTLALISGPRALERNLFPILYLLLRRHCDIMRVAQRVIVHPEEFADAEAAIQLVKDAFDERRAHVRGLFAQRRLNVQTELSGYVCGLLSNSPDDSYTTAAIPSYLSLGDELHRTLVHVPTEAVLRYPPHLEEFYPEDDDAVESEGSEVINELKPLLGHWAGLRTYDTEWATHRDYFALTFHISPTEPTKVVAIPRLDTPWLCTRVTFTAEYAGTAAADGRRTYTLTASYNTRVLLPTRFSIALSADGTTLSGEQESPPAASAPDGHAKPLIVFKKGLSPETMLFYPAPSALSADWNRAAALWRFALAAVRDDVRRRLCAWSFIRERRDRKRALASILRAELVNGTLHLDDAKKRAALIAQATPADLHFYAYVGCVAAGRGDGEPFEWLVMPCGQCGGLVDGPGGPCPRCNDGDEDEDLGLQAAKGAARRAWTKLRTVRFLTPRKSLAELSS